VRFLKVTADTVINLDAVASVSAGQDDDRFVTVVLYLPPAIKGSADESGLAFERFEDDDAHALYKFFTDPSHCLDLHDWADRNSRPDISA